MSTFEWVAIAIVTVMSSARMTRLVTYDKFPPMVWLRHHYAEWTDRHAPGWGLVAFCGYCASFWLTLAVVMWGWAVQWDQIWFLVNAVFGASYAAAIVMSKDGDDLMEDED